MNGKTKRIILAAVAAGAVGVAAPAFAQSQIPTERRKGRRRALRGEARLGHLQARRPHRGEGQGRRADQLRLLLPGLGHPAVLAAIRRRLRDRLQDGQRDLPDGVRLDRPGADRRQPAGRRRSRPSSPPARSTASRSSRSTSDSTTAITNKLMDQGIPVFTVGVTSRGHEFTNFTQVPMLEGPDRRRRSCSTG